MIRRRVVFFIIWASPVKGALEALKEMGLTGFVRKPYRSNELSQIIYQALNKKNLNV
jgi:FixJ family two-component response regulator